MLTLAIGYVFKINKHNYAVSAAIVAIDSVSIAVFEQPKSDFELYESAISI